MTSKKTTRESRGRLVEDILETVQSIDKNVEDILDRLSDHFEASHYRTNWGHDDYTDTTDYHD